jgi:D-3-phosphoglycerate dehydrogenase
MRVLGFDVIDVPENPDVEVVELTDLLAESDVVSLHLPVTPETRHLINTPALELMKHGAWLINVSRGALVDEDALVVALGQGRIGAAALDVFEEEPVSASNPLLGFDNVIVGSHNGSNTSEAVARTTELAVENLIEGLMPEGSS